MRRSTQTLAAIAACAFLVTLSLFARLPHGPSAAPLLPGVSPRALGDEPAPWGGALSAADGACPAARSGCEYGGDVVKWGADHRVADAAACCAACAAQPGCNTWVFCAAPSGCGGGRAAGECWLKRKADTPAEPQVLGAGPAVGWTSGALFGAEDARRAEAKTAQRNAALAALRYAPGNPRVFLDVSIDGQPAQRIEMMLFLSVSPNAAGNFLGMCRGDKGGKYTYAGARFYRILDAFIDQTGVEVPALNGGSFQDDAGGLALKHDRPGLLSMANSGPNTNTNHFSILMAPAPHLDGSYTIFGEVVRGAAVTRAINKLASPSGAPTGTALIVAAGQLE